MALDDGMVLLILGYLSRFKKEFPGNGYFILPWSEENLFLNLKRISRQAPFFVRTQLKEFLKRREKDIEVETLTDAFDYMPQFTYSGKSYTHTSSYHARDDELQYPERVLILHDNLIKETKDAYETYNSGCEAYLRELLLEAKTVRDLLFLLWLKQIVEENLEGRLAQLEPDWDKRSDVLVAFDSLEKLLKDLEVDEEVLHTLFSISGETQDTLLKEFEKFSARVDQKSFVILYAHSFNSSSCQPLRCLYFHESAARSLHSMLATASLERQIQGTYTSVVTVAQHEHIAQVSDLVKRWLSTEVELAPQRGSPPILEAPAEATRGKAATGSTLQPREASSPETAKEALTQTTEKERTPRSLEESNKVILIKDVVFEGTGKRDASLNFNDPSYVLNVVLQNNSTESSLVKIKFEMPSVRKDIEPAKISLERGKSSLPDCRRKSAERRNAYVHHSCDR